MHSKYPVLVAALTTLALSFGATALPQAEDEFPPPETAPELQPQQDPSDPTLEPGEDPGAQPGPGQSMPEEQQLPEEEMQPQEPPPAQTEPGRTDSSQPGTPSSAAAVAPIEDRKIEQFADAYVAVQAIQQQASTELQNAADPAQADKVQATAEANMIAAVERSGLQVAEFNQIAQTMAVDTDVRSRVAAQLQKRSGRP